MIVCRADDVSRHYTSSQIFEGLSFQIEAGDRIGLVGPNGAGKSTLLRVLLRQDPPDSGSVHFHPDASVQMLSQFAEFAPGRTLIAEARGAMKHLADAYTAMLDAGARLAEARDEIDRKHWSALYDERQEMLQRHGGYEFDHRIEEVLFGLGFTAADFDRPLRTFSGGQQSRVLLAKLLLGSPDLMLLDEPTNHLDIATTEWLEDYLRRQDAAMVMVSHDRYFLDKTATAIWELHAGRLAFYPGNYQTYSKLRAERQKVADRVQTKQKEQIAHYEDFIRRNKAGQLAKQAKGREKMLVRLEANLVETISDIRAPRMAFGEASRAGDIVVTTDRLGMEFHGKKLFADFSYQLERGQRLGIIGPNGAGKTTLLKILLGEETPTSGKAKLGHGVNAGYLDQNLDSLDPDATPLESVRPPWRAAEKAEPFRALLAKFGVGSQRVEQTIKTLSGGERTRVALARLCAYEVNLLALDEPTNHLDLWACEALEEALRDFDGTVLVVSHDRYFLNQVVDRLLYVGEGVVAAVPGNYDRYLELRQCRQEEAEKRGSANAKPIPGKAESKRPKRRFPYRRPDAIEADIADRERKVAAMEQLLHSPEVYKDGRRVKEVNEQLDELRGELAQLLEHWEEAMTLNT